MSIAQLSIVIPVHNRRELVIRTLESVKVQTYRPLKLILIDNDSTDDSLSALLQWSSDNEDPDFEIEVASESVPGAAAARNAGLKLVRTPWVMFFDSDDVMQPDHIASAFETLQQNPFADIIGWDVNMHTLDGKVMRKVFVVDDCLYRCVIDGTMATQRYMVRTPLVTTVGGWDNTVRMWNDIELGTRLLQLPSLEIVKREGPVLVDIFCQSESITGTLYSERSEWLEHSLKVMSGNLPDYLQYIVRLKAAILAALYRREGVSDKAQALLDATLDDEDSHKCRLLYRLAYSYTSMGGRGAAKILRKCFRP